MKTAENIDDAVDALLQHFVNEKSAAFCSALTPIAISGLTIYLILVGMAIGRGTSPDPMRELLWKLLRISFIVSIALSAGTYQSFIVGGLDSIGATVLGAMSGVTSFAAIIDNVADPFTILGEKLWSSATTGVWPHVGLLFAAAVTSLSQTILFSVGLGFYLLAKVSIALIMALGPGFLLCGIWPSTTKYLENWLGQALNYIFLKVLVSLSVVMLTSFVSQYAAHITTNIDTVNVIEAAISLLLSAIVVIIVILFLPYLASALFGGASVSGIGRAAMHTFLRMLDTQRSGKSISDNRISNGGGNAKPPNSIASSPLYQRHALNQLQTSRSRRAA